LNWNAWLAGKAPAKRAIEKESNLSGKHHFGCFHFSVLFLFSHAFERLRIGLLIHKSSRIRVSFYPTIIVRIVGLGPISHLTVPSHLLILALTAACRRGQVVVIFQLTKEVKMDIIPF